MLAVVYVVCLNFEHTVLLARAGLDKQPELLPAPAGPSATSTGAPDAAACSGPKKRRGDHLHNESSLRRACALG